ncbi:adenosylcobinamide-GDP ribazoletransferase [Intestinibacillus sp. Marseille-P6563]|uniref:adenosylcobinamide-GDP ribazoletransferase n=1 Tax=Intestinibacillus sp. Marseille-P6563 TaxID=2364792 RepID=UPI000F0602E3|nr:adenosylcobinamide-GDP ribazoletransferase [Intestinibacillus sp. Marseille-P6563]
MKSIVSGFLVAFSLYSAIPVLQVNWEKKTMRWALSFLPLVGLVIGGLEWLWYRFCVSFGASVVLYAIVATLLPLIVSGGIHLDGVCDTCDALCSFGDREKRLAILKDSHVGAFGPLWMVAFLLAEVACFAQIYETPQFLPLMMVGFATARAAGGAKIVTMPCAKDSGLAHLFAENSDKKVVAVVLVAQALMYLIAASMVQYAVPHGITAGTAALLLLLVWYFVHDRLCRRIFGGITGDLAGFFISTSELLMLAVVAFGGLVA